MDSTSPKFSLIVATYGDGHYLRRFLDSVRDNAGPSCEIIIVDQNETPHFDIVTEYSSDLVIRLIRAAPGLSAARNIGMKEARGSLIAFPDDDCWYPPHLLSAVEARMKDSSLSGLTCRCTDEYGRLAAGSEDRSAGLVSKHNVWGRGVSATIFIRDRLVHAIGDFDEALGLGATTKFQSGEETDYLLRAIKAGFRIEYDPSLSVFHPLPTISHPQSAARKSAAYGLGMGRVLRIHEYGWLDVLRHVAKPLLGAAGAMVRGNTALARVRYLRAVGRYQGWRWHSEQDPESNL